MNVLTSSSTEEIGSNIISSDHDKIAVSDLPQSIVDAWNAASLRPLAPVLSNVRFSLVCSAFYLKTCL